MIFFCLYFPTFSKTDYLVALRFSATLPSKRLAFKGGRTERNDNPVLLAARHCGEHVGDRCCGSGKTEAISSPQPRLRNTAMPTCRQYGRVVSGLVGEMKPPNTGQLSLKREGIFCVLCSEFLLSPYPKPGFLSFFCGLFLSFARKKEKPRSWLSSGGSGSEKRWLLLTQQATR